MTHEQLCAHHRALMDRSDFFIRDIARKAAP
jgi:hypothetical protein